MPSGWRIVKARHAAAAFSGEGARLNGGGWNSPGVAMVYLSAHQSLAALEIFVHLRPLLPRDDYVIFAVEWADGLTSSLNERDLPADWRVSPPGPSTAAIGDEWAKSGRSAVLALPSAMIPAETNFLLNSAQRDFRRIKIGKAAPFLFDPRLIEMTR